MSFKENINKLHFDLTSKYEVSIEECQSKMGNFVKFHIKESKKELIVNINKSSLEKNLFDWTYNSDPLNENSDLIERTSTLDKFIVDITDVFEKNRFSSDYLKKLN